MTQEDTSDLKIKHERELATKEWLAHHREHAIAWENHDKWHLAAKEAHNEVHHSQLTSIELAEVNTQRHFTAINGLQAQMERLQSTYATKEDVDKGNTIRDKQIDELRLFRNSAVTSAALIGGVPSVIAILISIVTFVLMLSRG